MGKERIARYNKKISRLVFLGLALFLVGLTFVIPSYVFGAKKIKLTAQPTDKTIKLYWETTTEGIDEFVITKTSKEEKTEIKVSGDKSFYVDSEVAQRTDYTYQVHATRKGKKIEASNQEKNIILVKADNPHGMYSDSTSLCSTCHIDKENNVGKSEAQLQAEGCFKCHESLKSDFAASAKKGSAHPVVAGTMDLKCSACHNPHKTADEINPKLLRFSFKLANQEKVTMSSVSEDFCLACHQENGRSSKIIDNNVYKKSKHSKLVSEDSASKSISCNNCHTQHASKYNSLLIANFDPLSKKSSVENNQLCFSCHGKDSKNNILNYYNGDKDGENKGHYIKDKDLAKALGVSQGWQLSCADCHSQHGTKNTKMIADTLGDFSDIKDVVKRERAICTSCHAFANDKGEKSSFRKVKFSTLPDTVGQHKPVPDGNLKSCSTCHGNNNMVAGAHAPKSGLTPRPPKSEDKPSESEEPKAEEPTKEPQPADDSNTEPSDNNAPSNEQPKDDSTVKDDAYNGSSGQ